MPEEVYETWIQLTRHLEDVAPLLAAIRNPGTLRAVHRSVPWEPKALALLRSRAEKRRGSSLPGF